MLTKRREAILDVIIGEYVASVTPVASGSIARRPGLQVSAATIRNEMAELEEEGYIHRRHVSGGGIPSDKGYRHHLDSMPPSPSLSQSQQRYVRRQFAQAARDLEAGTQRVTELASELVQNMALATVPKAAQSRIKRLEVVALQEALALLVLVLQEARIKQRLLPLESAMTQDELTALSSKLSDKYRGASRGALAVPSSGLTTMELQVVNAANEIMLEEDASRFEEPHVTGLRRLLRQPEFSSSSNMRALVEVLEDRGFLKELLAKLLAGERFRAGIGEENESDEMQQCTILVSSYGSPDGVSGLIGVIGPTRLEYRQSVAAIQLISSLMGELVGELN